MLRLIREWRKNVYRTSSYDQFFESDEWLELRRQTFKRDRQICQRCDRRFKIADLNAHHIMPRAEGGADDIHNLVTLCEPCHDIVEIAGYRTRAEIAGSYEDQGEDAPMERPTEKDGEDPYHRPRWHKWVYGGQKALRKP